MHNNTENIIRKVTVDEARGYYSPLEVEERGDGFMIIYPIEYCLNGFSSFLKVLIPSTISVDKQGVKRWPFTVFFDQEKTALETELARAFLFDDGMGYHAIRGWYSRAEKGELLFEVDDEGEDIALIIKGKFHFYCKGFTKYDLLKFADNRTLLLAPMDNFALSAAH